MNDNLHKPSTFMKADQRGSWPSTLKGHSYRGSMSEGRVLFKVSISLCLHAKLRWAGRGPFPIMPWVRFHEGSLIRHLQFDQTDDIKNGAHHHPIYTPECFYRPLNKTLFEPRQCFHIGSVCHAHQKWQIMSHQDRMIKMRMSLNFSANIHRCWRNAFDCMQIVGPAEWHVPWWTSGGGVILRTVRLQCTCSA